MTLLRYSYSSSESVPASLHLQQNPNKKTIGTDLPCRFFCHIKEEDRQHYCAGGLSFRKVCSWSGGVRAPLFASGGIGRRGSKMRNNEGFFLFISFSLTILYPTAAWFAITERFRFEYSSDMKCLRTVSQRLHNSDNNYNRIVRFFFVPFCLFCII